ncbi:DUF6104 family protein [Streptomyces viridiviolaceus]
MEHRTGKPGDRAPWWDGLSLTVTPGRGAGCSSWSVLARNGGSRYVAHSVYFTDRGIEERVNRRGEEDILFEWPAKRAGCGATNCATFKLRWHALKIRCHRTGGGCPCDVQRWLAIRSGSWALRSGAGEPEHLLQGSATRMRAGCWRMRLDV